MSNPTPASTPAPSADPAKLDALRLRFAKQREQQKSDSPAYVYPLD